jgi:hypothetical protein
MSRRAVLRFGLIAAALPLAAACGQAPAPTATTAPAKPAAPAAAPAAASPVSSPAASPAAAASPVASGAAIPPTPNFNKARIDGKLSVIIDADFYPEHNAFVEQKIREFCDKMGYSLDFSTVASFVGTANISQKLTAAVQANDSPDVLTHPQKTSTLKFLEVL